MEYVHLNKDGVKRKTRIVYIIACILVLCAVLSATDAQAASITVAWDPSTEPGAAGYRIYYGTSSGNYTHSIDAGLTTSCVISQLQDGITYYLSVTVYDGSGDESGFSNEIVYGNATAGAQTGSSASSGGGGCFIATAAFGSELEPEVALLRAFRDDWLLTNAPGRLFVETYYRLSPPVADFIRQNEPLRLATRIALMPIIYSVKHPLAAFLVPVCLLLAFKRRGTRAQKRLAGHVSNPP